MPTLRMKFLLRRAPLLLSMLLLSVATHAAPAPSAGPEQNGIRKVLDAQVEAWNRGDISTFMQGYNNSPSTTFVGKTVEHGYAGVLARYQKAFGTKEKMGTLNFSDLEITPLDPQIAVATGRFHLARTPAGGGDAQGIFSLVFRRTAAGWKIVLDHTS
jgi:ketosteroid isomerase-like protein